MIAAIDIETIKNDSVIELLPEPSVKLGNLKDPVKIKDKIAEAKVKQVDDMALNAETGRICAFSLVGVLSGGNEEKNRVEVLAKSDDENETVLVQQIMRVLGLDQARFATWDGIRFDMPYIYKRAMILGVDPANFNAPPLDAWTKRYTTDRHFDLAKIWSGWGAHDYNKLGTIAQLVLGEKKIDIDVKTFPELIKTEDGRKALGEYCLMDSLLTWRLFQKFNGCLFS